MRRYNDDLARIRRISANMSSVLAYILELVRIGDMIKAAQKEAGGVSKFNLPPVGNTAIQKLIYPFKAAIAKIKQGGINVLSIAILRNMLKHAQSTVGSYVASLARSCQELDDYYSKGIGTERNVMQRGFDKLHVAASKIYQRLGVATDKLYTDLMAKTSKPIPNDYYKGTSRVIKEVPKGRFVSSGVEGVDVYVEPNVRKFGASRFGQYKHSGPSNDIIDIEYKVKRDSYRRRHRDSIASEIGKTLDNISLAASHLKNGRFDQAFGILSLTRMMANMSYNEWCDQKKKEMINIMFEGNRKERLKQFIAGIGRSLVDTEKAKAILNNMKNSVKDGRMKESIISLLKQVGDMLKRIVKLKSDAEQKSQSVGKSFSISNRPALTYS